MERIDKQAILHRTHYGLGIYAHILRQCFPADEVALTLSGRDCGLCRNPFAEGARTLHIFIHKTDPANALSPEYARHTTTDQSIPDGDAFTFAQLHYQQSGNELLETLNHEMHLHIGEKNLWYNKKNGCAVGAPYTPIVETSYHGVSHNASLLPLREVGRVYLSSCRGKGTSPAGNEAKELFSFFKSPISNTKPYKNITIRDAYNYIVVICNMQIPFFRQC